MRIAMITGSYPPQPCGVGDYTERLVDELKSAGVDVEVVTTRSPDRKDATAVSRALPKWTIFNWVKTLRWMRAQHYELIHVQYPARFYGYRPSLALLSVLAKVLLPGVPVVVTLHEFRITHPLRKLTSIALSAPAAALVLTADSERTAVERWMPWVRKRVQVLTMASTIPVVPVSEQRRRELRQFHGIADDETVIVFFGLLHPNKGIETVLESFAAVHGRLPNTRLLMLSLFDPSKIPYHATLLERAAALGIANAVVWTGYLDNAGVSEHLTSADIGFFPFQDGVTLRRLSFMTGMSHGLPIVTTIGHAGTREIGLRDGENVLLVPAGGPVEEFVSRMISLASDPSLRGRLAKRAREWAAPFQWKAIVPRLVSIYSGVIERTGVPDQTGR